MAIAKSTDGTEDGAGHKTGDWHGMDMDHAKDGNRIDCYYYTSLCSLRREMDDGREGRLL